MIGAAAYPETHDADSLARYGLAVLDRELRRYRWATNRLTDEMRSEAHWQLARSIPRALDKENPETYVTRIIRNAFVDALRAHKRQAKRVKLLEWKTLVDDSPRPDIVAMFREEMRPHAKMAKNGPRPGEMKPYDMKTLNEIMSERPTATNVEILIVLNRKTGRNFCVDTVSCHRAKHRRSLTLGGK